MVKPLAPTLLLIVLAVGAGATDGDAGAGLRIRIKDITRIAGNEEYTLTGYGLVAGLAGSGDSDEQLTQQTIAALLQNFNVVVDPANAKAQNTAAVIVTATTTTAAHRGDMIPATVSSIGDAQSLTGGELLLTPLLGPDGEVWGTAQGAISTGGFSFGSSGKGGDMQSKNHPTTAMLTNGVKLLRNVRTDDADGNCVSLLLAEPDYTTAVNIADAVNRQFPNSATAVDRGTVRVIIPRSYLVENATSRFMQEIEQIRVVPDMVAKVVINERTGTIVFGADVRISQVAISHGDLTISIKNTQGVSQPAPFSGGSTQTLSDQMTVVTEENASICLLPDVTTVTELVSSLNALGVTPRDTIVILHALREAGALHAELESM
jgi:flagellar P-ring protein precursor FlgI